MSLVAVLQAELRNLSGEARKKFPNIKEAAERAIMRLRNLSEGGNNIKKHAEAIARADDVLRPFLMACETKNTKIVAIAVASLQQMIAHNAISEASLPTIISTLSALVDSDDETVQLKTLQAMVALLSSSLALHGDALAKALMIGFRLHQNRNSSVQNTASASLRQVVTMLFDKAIAEASSHPQENGSRAAMSPADSTLSAHPRVPTHLAPYAADCYSLLLDLCHLTGGDSPSWLPLENMSRAFGLELIETLLDHHTELFSSVPEFAMVLKDRVCPLVIKSFRLRSDFSHTVRLMRIIGVFLRNFLTLMVPECEVFLSRLLRMLETEKLPWLRTLALEVLRSICADPTLLRAIYQNYDVDKPSTAAMPVAASGNGPAAAVPPARMFYTMVHAVSRTVQSAFDLSADGQVTVEAEPGRPRCLDLLAQTDPPVVDTSYVVYIAMETLVDIVKGLGILAGVTAGHNDGDTGQSGTGRLLRDMADTSWAALHPALSLLLAKAANPQLVDTILNACQLYTTLCAVMDLSTPRDAFLTMLCKTAIPHLQGTVGAGSGSADPITAQLVAVATTADDEAADDTVGGDIGAVLTFKNVKAIQVLLEIVHSVGNKLDTAAWLLALQVFEQADAPVTSAIGRVTTDDSEVSTPTSGGGAAAGDRAIATGGVQLASAELSGLAAAMSGVYKSSPSLDDVAVRHCLSALAQLSTAALKPLNAPSVRETARARMYPLSRFVEVASANLHRLRLLWDLVSEHLLYAACHKNNRVRTFAVDSLTHLVSAALADIGRLPLAERTSEATGLLQKQLLEALDTMVRSPHTDARDEALTAVHHILQAAGQTLTIAGWPVVLSILITVAANNDRPHILTAFQSVQFICSDFLPSLPLGCLALSMSTVGFYARQSSDINISLTAIGLLWNIADFLGKGFFTVRELSVDDDAKVESQALFRENPLNKLWLGVFTEMKQLCADARPEVRNCAVITLFKTLSTYGGGLESATWQACLWEILFPMLQEVRSAAVAAAAKEPKEIAPELGRNTGRGVVHMLVHHSRNTAQKQWDETQVLALNGMARVIKAFSPLLAPHPKFEDAWKRLLAAIEAVGSATNSREVTVCAIKCLQDLLLTLVGTADFAFADVRKPLWEATWQTLEAVSTGFARTAGLSHKTLVALLDTLGDLFAKHRAFFTLTDQKRLVRIVQPLGCYPCEFDDETTFLHNAVLKFWRVLLSIPPPAADTPANELGSSRGTSSDSVAAPEAIDAALLPLVVCSLLHVCAACVRAPFESRVLDAEHYLPPIPSILLPALPTAPSANSAPSGSRTGPPALVSTPYTAAGVTPSASSQLKGSAGQQSKQRPKKPHKALIFAENVLNIACHVFVDMLPQSVQAHAADDIFRVIGAAMQTKFTFPEVSLWRTAMDSALRLTPVVIRAVKATGMSDQAAVPLWDTVGRIMEEFLFHEQHRVEQDTQQPADAEAATDMDVQLIETLSTHILSSTAPSFLGLQRRFLEVLLKGAEQFEYHRDKLAQACYMALFSHCACSASTPQETAAAPITRAVASVLMERCAAVLRQFTAAASTNTALSPSVAMRMGIPATTTTTDPPPRPRLTEVCFVLRQLSVLELAPTVLEDKPRGKTGRWTHLLKLFPLLCDCVGCRDAEVKDILKELLHIVARELELE